MPVDVLWQIGGHYKRVWLCSISEGSVNWWVTLKLKREDAASIIHVKAQFHINKLHAPRVGKNFVQNSVCFLQAQSSSVAYYSVGRGWFTVTILLPGWTGEQHAPSLTCLVRYLPSERVLAGLGFFCLKEGLQRPSHPTWCIGALLAFCSFAGCLQRSDSSCETSVLKWTSLSRWAPAGWDHAVSAGFCHIIPPSLFKEKKRKKNSLSCCWDTFKINLLSLDTHSCYLL